jgi:serine/tyrosine/threonine adenylyltransferase
MKQSLQNRTFDSGYCKQLKADPNLSNCTRVVTDTFYSAVSPTPVKEPKILAWSDSMAELLNLNTPSTPIDETAQILGGNMVTPSMTPYASRYGGHQFGAWAGQLGDGRAISLGDLRGVDNCTYEIQLKGAGPTPYSRRGDGRAVLRSSLREFLCSEAMHHLGVPTTRALSLTVTGESVVRDMFYDGHPEEEPGAIVCRVAPTFIRFGNFEILAANNELQNLKDLLDFTITNYFCELGAPSQETYALWFAEVCRRTAVMIAHWMTVGFVHGVMNTDNMSVLGLTIDYGPYGWLEPYQTNWTPNTTDSQHRRYCFGNQPRIALWNLEKLAQSIVSLLKDPASIEVGLSLYRSTLHSEFYRIMANKLALGDSITDQEESLIEDLIECFEDLETDITIFYRRLSSMLVRDDLFGGNGEVSESCVSTILESSYKDSNTLKETSTRRIRSFLNKYINRLGVRDASIEDRITTMHAMNKVNPKFVIRNYLAHNAAVEASAGNTTLLNNLITVLTSPFEEHPDLEHLAIKRPDWAKTQPGCATLSCSS